MQSWKTTQSEFFCGSQIITCGYFKVDKYFVTYQRYNIWYEMKFEHNLN